MVFERPLTAAEIYEQVTGGKGPGSLSEAATAAERLHRAFTDFATDLRDIAKETEHSWDGDAGNHAAGLTKWLARTLENDKSLVWSVNRSLTDQITEFVRARAGVVPVPPQPPAPTLEDMAHELFGDNSYQAKLDAYERDVQNNIAVYRAYHQASLANAGILPLRYPSPPPTADGSEITRADVSGQPSSTTQQLSPMGGGPGSIEQVEAPPPSTPPIAVPEQRSSSRPPVDTASPSPPSEHTDTTHAAAAHVSESTVTAPPSTSGDHRINRSDKPNTHASTPQYNWVPPAAGGRVGNPASETRTVPRGPTTPPNSPASERIPAAPPGRGSGAGPGGGLGNGPARPGTAPPQGTAHGAVAKGTPGAPPGPPARGGGADKDRRRPGYLRNSDPKDTFSDPLPKTAPPVIGQPRRTPRGKA